MKKIFALLSVIMVTLVLTFSNTAMSRAEEPTIVDSDWDEEVTSKNEQSSVTVPETTPVVTTTKNTETTKKEDITTKREESTTTQKTETTTKKTNVVTTKKSDTEMKTTRKVATTKSLKAPGKVKNVKLTAGKKSLKIKWKKISGIKKYQIQVCTSRKFKKSIIKKTSKSTTLTVKKLKARKKYYVRVRAVKTSGKQTAYGKWSKILNKKTK